MKKRTAKDFKRMTNFFDLYADVLITVKKTRDIAKFYKKWVIYKKNELNLKNE